jgi:putative membrane protein
LPILLVTYRRFPFSPLAYGLLLVHAVILLVGAHYTYAEMPLFNWLRDTFDLDRNYYDRLGHVAQGFIPAIVAREILLRRSPLRPGKWLAFIVVSIALAISALYEMLEWWVALASGSEATAFLATQGDVWDTQWDMFLCLLGAMASLMLLSRRHDRSLQRLP